MSIDELKKEIKQLEKEKRFINKEISLKTIQLENLINSENQYKLL